jgi:hypothetical protein
MKLGLPPSAKWVGRKIVFMDGTAYTDIKKAWEYWREVLSSEAKVRSKEVTAKYADMKEKALANFSKFFLPCRKCKVVWFVCESDRVGHEANCDGLPPHFEEPNNDY